MAKDQDTWNSTDKMKGEIDKSTKMAGDFHNLLSETYRKIRPKVNKEVEGQSNTINRLYLTDISGTLHPTTAEYTFLSSANTTSCRP